MNKIIVITGATGAQGGGVANILLDTPGWKVRAITRNANSDKAKVLAVRGAEVVQANFDDVESLKEAFKNAHAIFAVTNFWEHLFKGNKSPDEAGRLEEEQAMKLVQAADQTTSLEHYIWSTAPGANNLTKGRNTCPHIDYKANVDARIRKEFPALAQKTTFLFVGFYSTNLVFIPMMKPFELPGSNGKYIWMLPTPHDATIPVTGDMTITPGIWVRQILAYPEKSKRRYALVATEVLTFGEILKAWSEVTGRPSTYIHIGGKEFEEIWGVPGKELLDQLSFGEVAPDWPASSNTLSAEELGVTVDGTFGHRKAFESLKEFL